MVEIFQQDKWDIPSPRTQVGTRKLGDVNAELLSFNTIGGEKPLDGPCVLLFFPDGTKPLELWNIATVTLGRADNYGKKQPMIDLNSHHGALLGVSRLHAEIFYRDGNYFVRDLESTNGTWVNSHKLEHHHEMQLLDGDTLRLGHLMIQIGGC